MGGVTFGDIFFIALVGGGIYLLLGVVKRPRQKSKKRVMNGDAEKENSQTPGEGARPGKSDNLSS